MNRKDTSNYFKFLIFIITLSFMTCNCSARNSSEVLQNTPTSPPLQHTLVVETKTPYETITPNPSIDKQGIKTKTPYSTTPTNIPLEFQDWYDPNPSFVLSNEEISNYIKLNIGKTSFGGEAFCAFTPLNNDRGRDGFIYLWVLCEEYYIDDGNLQRGTGLSTPVSLELLEIDEKYEIIDHFSPRDGSYYPPDVKQIFPENTWNRIHKSNQGDIYKSNYRIHQLENDIQKQVMSRFDVDHQ
ncbi:MAG: hypothetical protein KGY46_04970 [Anaerolineales bacterium]|nr:hypothetical protein [Anaerolineales bacterium]